MTHQMKQLLNQETPLNKTVRSFQDSSFPLGTFHRRHFNDRIHSTIFTQNGDSPGDFPRPQRECPRRQQRDDSSVH